MEKLQHALAVVLEKIGNVGGALSAEQRVVRHQHKVWSQAKKKSERYAHEADRERQAGRPKKAKLLSRKSHKQHVRAEAAKLRGQPAIAEVKRLARRKHGLEQTEAQIRAELKDLKSSSGVKINGNKATGGSRRARIGAVAFASIAACASGKRANRYKQDGYWEMSKVITGEPYSARSDCSQWELAVCHCANVPDPTKRNYGSGFTGTILDAPSTSRSALRMGDSIVYGEGDGFHTELYLGDGHPNHTFGETGNPRTGGHGSPPIDFGIVDLIPGVMQRYRKLA